MSDHDEKYGPCPGETTFLWDTSDLPKAATTQPLPTGSGRPVLPELIKDLEAKQPLRTGSHMALLAGITTDLESRSQVGITKYGTPLKTDNGRSALLDLYQELLDAAMYIKQLLMEQEGQ